MLECVMGPYVCVFIYVRARALLQDAANATLQSETLRETMCNAIIANGGVREPSKMPKMFVMMDASNTVQFN